MQSKATTVAAYLAELPADRRAIVKVVRALIRKHLPAGYQEGMQYGMISYFVPLSRYPKGYLDRKDTPLPYVSLASQRNHLSLYLMNIYGDPSAEKWFRAAWAKAGKKLDMGKSCVRFRSLDDLALDVVGEAIARASVDETIARYEACRSR